MLSLQYNKNLYLTYPRHRSAFKGNENFSSGTTHKKKKQNTAEKLIKKIPDSIRLNLFTNGAIFTINSMLLFLKGYRYNYSRTGDPVISLNFKNKKDTALKLLYVLSLSLAEGYFLLRWSYKNYPKVYSKNNNDKQYKKA